MNAQITPKQGDRLIINNVPEDYHYKDLYITEGQYMGVIEQSLFRPEFVVFTTGYTPYFNGNKFSCSGSGHHIEVKNVKFVKTAPANFWKFRNGEVRTHNEETYQKEVNYFECDFSDIK